MEDDGRSLVVLRCVTETCKRSTRVSPKSIFASSCVKPLLKRIVWQFFYGFAKGFLQVYIHRFCFGFELRFRKHVSECTLVCLYSSEDSNFSVAWEKKVIVASQIVQILELKKVPINKNIFAAKMAEARYALPANYVCLSKPFRKSKLS